MQMYSFLCVPGQSSSVTKGLGGNVGVAVTVGSRCSHGRSGLAIWIGHGNNAADARSETTATRNGIV